MTPVPPETVDRFAAEILGQIRDMQENGYSHGTAFKGRLPKVASFSELHDYFDANVGWGDEFEQTYEDAREHATDFMNDVFDKVDAELRAAAEPEPTAGRVTVPVDGLDKLMSALERCWALHNKWDNAVNLQTGETHVVAKAFAADLKEALGGS